MQQLMTAQQLAPLLGVVDPDNIVKTLRRHEIFPTDKHGKTLLFSLDDVAKVPAWSGVLQAKGKEAAAICIRKARADRGLPRNVSAHAVDEAVSIAKSLYLSSGMPDLRMACDSALKLLVDAAGKGQAGCTLEEALAIKGDWFYRRWVRRRDEYMLGPYHKEGWQELWRQAWKQHDAALTSPYAARTSWKIFENAGWAGEGYGFGWMVVLDDRSADVWTVDTESRHVLPNAIYVWDMLTGALLFVEPSQEITTQAYIRAILGAVFLHNLSTAPLVVLENAKAAKSVRITDLIAALYGQEDLDRIWQDRNLRKLCNGETGPVFRNVPHIAREFGKAFAERSFGVVKREHDAPFSPTTFQGGNRQEAVQMHRSNQPFFLSRSLVAGRHDIDTTVPTLDSYFLSLYQWAQTEYLDRERASLKLWAKEKGLRPTRRDMVLYYGGGIRENGEMNLPVERFALAIYAATPKHWLVKVRHPGRIGVTMNGQPVNIVSPEIGPELVGRTCGIVPVPTVDGHYVVVLYRWQKRVVEKFICVARDLTATTIEQAALHREEARRTREELHARIDAEITVARSGDHKCLLGRLDEEKRVSEPARPEWLGALDASDVAEADIIVEDAEDAIIINTADEDPDAGCDEIDRLMEL